MRVREGMSKTVLSVGPDHTLRDAARLMAERRVGAAVIMDPDGAGPAIITERDVLESIGAGQDPDTERVGQHLTSSLVVASPEWSLEEAAAAMVQGNFRHLVVVDRGDICGVLAMRDIVRCWTGEGATSDMPAGAASA
ncbi:MAG: CBS domain-containing protein [Actinobacteria bacterium]|nr:MAG: CBS domain-containing protein [Actinomycetota bacterium]